MTTNNSWFCSSAVNCTLKHHSSSREKNKVEIREWNFHDFAKLTSLLRLVPPESFPQASESSFILTWNDGNKLVIPIAVGQAYHFSVDKDPFTVIQLQRKMGSKGRIPPPHMRHPLPGPGMVHSEPFGLGIPTRPGPFPHFDMLPPPEIMEQKLAAQHVEMQKLGTENQRIAATHGTLRQELAAAQHELQISKMEAELKAAEPVKKELQLAHSEAQNLVLAREELLSKMHQLNQEVQRAHVDVQQIPALMAELESVRQEYQHCRATFDYEKKLYNDHLESLQRHGALPPAAVGANVSAYDFSRTGSGPAPARSGYEMSRGRANDFSRTTGYESQRVPVCDAQRGPSYDGQRAHVYDQQRGAGYDTQRGSVNDPSSGATYDAAARSFAVPRGEGPPQNNGPYGSATPPGRARNAYGGNPARR
ncbi:Sarcolemmal membrane-associated protein, putative isoform 2 [Hibiscus syriacus]|uniref:Sarcolemmal membrane-associated protein, putative isoform 2 n=1 Tax=Hibiscus syriacus TaxID=106335 RepID=A0A6A2Z0M1_HIBSY|nr:Sarcolemmal membrane-associated protein, putative isoform 2 [Hibiscus syriacus]